LILNKLEIIYADKLETDRYKYTERAWMHKSEVIVKDMARMACEVQERDGNIPFCQNDEQCDVTLRVKKVMAENIKDIL
jgi:hypothetical protein